MDSGMDELVTEFLVESFENLDQLDQDLIALEQDPGDRDVLQSIFRTIHTIKGTCGFLGFGVLESIAHAGENLLSLLRDGDATVDAEIASALLAMTDAVRDILLTIERTQEEGDAEYGALVETLRRLEQRARDRAAGAETPVAGAPEDATAADDAEEETAVPRLGELLVRQGAADPVDVAVGLLAQDAGDDRPVGEILVDHGVVAPDEVAAALQEQQEQQEQQREAKSSVADSTLRVDVDSLDRLMTLVGELVLARNQILQYASRSGNEPAFVNTTQRLNMITTELQAGIMKTRMQPIGTVWSKFPRVVRDLASSCGKRVRIEMEGKDTELDKTIVEAIKDPLTHVVRNSVDHGIESPDVRRAAGKPEEGLVLLRAFHEGGQVNIEISDDGAGIDAERVKRKALERGLITPEQAARMGDREALDLVWLPGLSTAEQVSNISGRGVGMDVVRTNIEKIGGSLDIQSRVGEGTTIRVKIPLTLAIVPALVVTCAQHRFCIPQVSLLELVGLESDGSGRSPIEWVEGAPVYRLRGQILPLVYLHKELGLVPADGTRVASKVVVLKADDRQFGLVVDEVHDTEEIVVKPLSPQVKGIRPFSGCTIMGDGQVALILDVLGVAQQARVISDAQEHAVVTEIAESGAATEGGVRETLLVVQAGDQRRVAIPLRAVDRLEEIEPSQIEHSGSAQVVQYRSSILELVDVGGALGFPPGGRDATRLDVVVCRHAGRTVGLVVDAIVDIVETDVVLQNVGTRYGLRGSTIVQGTVTDFVDLDVLIGAEDSYEEGSVGRV